jgi:aerobic carbon-monoxide dehydrogenase medium subunit
MKPAKFKYWAPATAGQIVDFLAEHGDDAKLLAGGQSLMPVMNMRLARPKYLVDLNLVDGLDEIREVSGHLAIGAMATQEAVLGSALAGQACPLLHAAIPWVGHLAIRHRGTVGGSLVHADPSAELPAVAIALDAQMVLRGPAGTRSVPAEEFFISYFTTAAEPDELLTEVQFPKQAADTRVAVQELARRHGDFALAGVAVSLTLAGADAVGSARICAFGVDEVPRRITSAEELLAGQHPTEELLREVGDRAAQAVAPEADMTGVLTRRAVREALGQTAAQAQ